MKRHFLTLPGSSLFEVIVALALTTMILGGGSIVYTRLLKDVYFTSATETLWQELRLARAYAATHTQGQDWGIATDANRIIRFQGSSFAGRNQALDAITLLYGGLSFSSTTVVFTRPGGRPASPKTFTLSNGDRTATIFVNTQGGINEQ